MGGRDNLTLRPYKAESRISDFSPPSILWGIDGNFEFNLIQPGITFETTDHCGTIQILEPSIVPEYMLFALYLRRAEESFDRSFRASLANMRPFTLQIPVLKDGTFDVAQQCLLADRYMLIQQKQQEIRGLKAALNEQLDRYVSEVRHGHEAH